MKWTKKMALLLGMLGWLFSASCNACLYEAYVTICNIGNLGMIGSVGNDEATIPKYESQTWSIPLNYEDEVVTVDLYAEPLVGNDYDSATATLYGDRDIVTWMTGWDAAGSQAQPQKKKSYFLKK